MSHPTSSDDKARELAQSDAIVKAFKCAAAVASVIVAVLLRVWAVMMLWKWYVMPVFRLAPLQPVHAYGLLLLVALVLTRARKHEDDPGFVNSLGTNIVGSLVALACGWIGSLFT